MRKLIKIMYWIPFVGMMVEFIDGVWHLEESASYLSKKGLIGFVIRVFWHLITTMIILEKLYL